MQLPVKEAGRFHFDTIIIGAGISGLAAAQRLLDSSSHTNKHSIAVLEARNRIGGRIGALNIDGNRLDTGANWIHGTGTDSKPNPILEFVDKSKFKELTSSVAFTCRTKGEFGNLVIPSSVSTEIFNTLWQLLGSLRATASDLAPETSRDTPILNAILEDERFKEAFKSIPEAYHGSLAGLPQMLEGMEAASLNETSAETPDDAPGMSMAEFATDGFDGDQVFLRDGYISVINKLAKDVIARDHIHLDTHVRQILWDRSPIEVLTNHGIYTAQDVVCTIPLGVLQHHCQQEHSFKSFFAPALPPDKLEAVTSLGFGTLDKIFMVYREPWWKEEPFYSIIQKGMSEMTEDGDPTNISPPEPDSFRGFISELPGIQITPNGIKKGPGGLFLVNLHALTGFPVLSAFVSCANARRIEALSDLEAGDIVDRAFKEWFGGLEPPKPHHVAVTRWAQDVWARGSYSHMITGKSEKRHRANFATPLVNANGNRLRFAGEHTVVDDFATAHGALLSGWREADALVADRISSK